MALDPQTAAAISDALRDASEVLAQTPHPPVRQLSALGVPKPTTSIERTCACCHASFLRLAPGATGERGLWDDGWHWFCSQECYDAPRGLGKGGIEAVLAARHAASSALSPSHPEGSEK